MADFVVRKRSGFVFAIEDAPEQTFTLPALSRLDFEDAKTIAQINDESDIVKRGKLVENFVLKHAPGLKGLVTGMEFFEIFNAYSLAMGRKQLGESEASLDS